MSEFDPYDRWLSILLEEQPPHHFRLLRITLYEHEAVIKAAAVWQMAYVKTQASGLRSAMA